MNQPWLNEAVIRHVAYLLKSFHHWIGRELLELSEDDRENAIKLFEAPFIVLSHGTEKDPVLNYGNLRALKLWEMTWDSFIHTPSRLTTEALNREERAVILKEVGQKGYSDHYQGVRVSSSGKRFRIENAIVWNLLDEEEAYCGQAALFDKWRYLFGSSK